MYINISFRVFAPDVAEIVLFITPCRVNLATISENRHLSETNSVTLKKETASSAET